MERKLKQRRKEIKTWFRGILYLLPAIVILGMFNFYPTIKVFLMSTYTSYNYFKHEVFEYGIGNYITLYNDPDFLLAIKNTWTFVLVMVPISIGIALLISVAIMKNKKINSFIQSVYFLPFVTSTVAVSAVWRWMFHSKYGLFNYFLQLLGIDPIAWLTDPDYAMTALIILCIWKTLGYNILILLTGLRNISKDYYNAAKVDGAGPFQTFFHITLPLLTPTIFFVTMTSLIGAFKVFSEVYSLFHKSPGPVNSCLTMVYFIYDRLVNQHSYGLAAAGSVVLFLMILGITLIQFWVNKKINQKLGYGKKGEMS